MAYRALLVNDAGMMMRRSRSGPVSALSTAKASFGVGVLDGVSVGVREGVRVRLGVFVSDPLTAGVEVLVGVRVLVTEER